MNILKQKYVSLAELIPIGNSSIMRFALSITISHVLCHHGIKTLTAIKTLFHHFFYFCTMPKLFKKTRKNVFLKGDSNMPSTFWNNISLSIVNCIKSTMTTNSEHRYNNFTDDTCRSVANKGLWKTNLKTNVWLLKKNLFERNLARHHFQITETM